MLTATKCYSIQDKEKFIKHFHRFVLSGFKYTLFHKQFYVNLSNMFGHIAHYDRYGFYATWFDTIEAQDRFMDRVRTRIIYGDPAYTWSDVERILQDHYRSFR